MPNSHSDDLEANLKTFAVTFMFPEMKGGSIYQSATAKGSDMGVAFSRAWKEVRKRPSIKGHRITTARITIAEAEK
jgi:hypothetical protein